MVRALVLWMIRVNRILKAVVFVLSRHLFSDGRDLLELCEIGG